MTRLTIAEALYLTLLQYHHASRRWFSSLTCPFISAVSLLIVVVVIMDFMGQVQSHDSHQYDADEKTAEGGRRWRFAPLALIRRER